MEDEDLLEIVKALEEVQDLSEEDAEFVKKVALLLRDEKKVSRKDKERLALLHKECLGEKGTDSDDDIDEDDFA